MFASEYAYKKMTNGNAASCFSVLMSYSFRKFMIKV